MSFLLAERAKDESFWRVRHVEGVVAERTVKALEVVIEKAEFDLTDLYSCFIWDAFELLKVFNGFLAHVVVFQLIF